MKRDFEQERARELTEAFFRVWKKGMTSGEAMRLAALQPCSRFWITPECVKLRLRYYGKHKYRLMRAMLEEIKLRLGGKTDIESIEQVVYSPAPQFYIAGDTARKIIQRELKRRRQCKRNNKH
jgi:hypothetical protein